MGTIAHFADFKTISLLNIAYELKDFDTMDTVLARENTFQQNTRKLKLYALRYFQENSSRLHDVSTKEFNLLRCNYVKLYTCFLRYITTEIILPQSICSKNGPESLVSIRCSCINASCVRALSETRRYFLNSLKRFGVFVT